MRPTRRPHLKSRSGCTECKRRRIKCSEETPRCHQCERYDKTCVYLAPNVRRSASNPNSDPGSNPSPSTCSPAAGILSIPLPSNPLLLTSGSPVQFALQDLALLHHWTMTTSVSIVSSHKLECVWQTLLPQVAFRHNYVMQSILSLTALHVAHLNPSNRSASMIVAADHHAKALDGFWQDMTRMCPENADALFANASLTFFYAFLTFGKLYNDDGCDVDGAARTSRILGTDWIPLVRGVESVLHPVYDLVRVGPLKSLLSLGNWGDPDPLDDQFLRIHETWASSEHGEVYDEALYLLRKCRLWIAQFEVLQIDPEPEWGYNRGWSGPFIWLFLAPEKYFGLLEQRQPHALLIFAFFGTLLHNLNHHWWMEGCGRSIVSVVDGCLGSYWSPWTEWPKQMVGSR